MSVSPLHVIVLDDRSRFALHAWRYLSRSVGFGIGDVPIDGESPGTANASSALRRPWRLETPAGDAVVWWVYIRKAYVPGELEPWVDELDKVLKEATETERRMFLVDVRGEPTGDVKEEFWSAALPVLSSRRTHPTPENTWPVSSYGLGIRRFPLDGSGQPFNIRPKSSATLQELAERIWSTTRSARLVKAGSKGKTAQRTFHFLVSGAGFELKSLEFPSINPLGVSPTRKLLQEAYRDPIWDDPAAVGDDKDQTYLPIPPAVKATPGWNLRVLGGAQEGLDQLWDSLLEWMLEEAKINNRRRSPSVQKAAMLEAEESARESFRAAFFGDDWGQLTQALDSVALPWDVWLTTNYTHFVDRAVTLQKGRSDEGAKRVPPWRILSIANEAERLLRRIFFDERAIEERSAIERFIFKLHGDLAHLSTMAIAGQDKELFSLMTRTVDNLHWLYEAAQKWMEGLLKVEGDARVLWHIVGHGLKDQALVRTIERVIDSTRESPDSRKSNVRHSFLFVQPRSKAGLKNIELAEKRIGCDWYPQPYGADVWLAMLRKFYRNFERMWTLEDGDLGAAVRFSIRSPNE
jgi:hypothetical protein